MKNVVERVTRLFKVKAVACPGGCVAGFRPDGSSCLRCAGSGVYFRPG